MSDLSREAQSIIDAARDADAPTATDRERIRAALVAKIGAPGLGTGAATSAGGNGGPGSLMNTTTAPANPASLAATTVSGTGKGALAAKILVGAALIGGLGYGGYLLFGGEKEDAARASADVQPVAIAREAPPVESAPAPVAPVRALEVEPTAESAAVVERADQRTADHPAAAEKQPRRNGKKRPADSPEATAKTGAATDDPLASLREEKKLISKAKEVLDAGNPSLAMKVLDRHASRFANGVLAQDRAGLRVLALCDLGKVERARKEADRFLARWPRAPMAHRVRAACASQSR